jgi:hypothetical protein
MKIMSSKLGIKVSESKKRIKVLRASPTVKVQFGGGPAMIHMTLNKKTKKIRHHIQKQKFFN